MEAGDFATIVGSNGAGKSTLFNAICRFVSSPTAVTVSNWTAKTSPSSRSTCPQPRSIGRLFQDPLMGTAPHMTIEENLSIAYLRASRSRHSYFSRITAKEKELFREQLSLLCMGLEDRMDSPVGLLSGGQRQALTLLMATMVTPKLLLLDEHTAALDPATAEKVLDLTKNIVSARSITCLMITHNMNQALTLGKRTLMMDGGHIVLDVSGEERRGMTVETLLERFAAGAGEEFRQ
jgi:putative ABC transport system ATP-binding protein